MQIETGVDMKISENIKLKLKGFLFPDTIAAVYLYGSIVKGNLRQDSDVDIAILISPHVKDMEKLKLISKVEGIFTSLVKGIGLHHEVSVLDLTGRYVSYELQYKVITEGISLYTGDMMKKLEFENTVKGEYFDFSPFLQSLRKRKYELVSEKA